MEYIKASKERISTIDSPYLNALFSSLAIYSLFFLALSLAFAILAIWLIIQKSSEVPYQK